MHRSETRIQFRSTRSPAKKRRKRGRLARGRDGAVRARGQAARRCSHPIRENKVLVSLPPTGLQSLTYCRDGEEGSDGGGCLGGIDTQGASPPPFTADHSLIKHSHHAGLQHSCTAPADTTLARIGARNGARAQRLRVHRRCPRSQSSRSPAARAGASSDRANMVDRQRAPTCI